MAASGLRCTGETRLRLVNRRPPTSTSQPPPLLWDWPPGEMVGASGLYATPPAGAHPAGLFPLDGLAPVTPIEWDASGTWRHAHGLIPTSWRLFAAARGERLNGTMRRACRPLASYHPGEACFRASPPRIPSCLLNSAHPCNFRQRRGDVIWDRSSGSLPLPSRGGRPYLFPCAAERDPRLRRDRGACLDDAVASRTRATETPEDPEAHRRHRTQRKQRAPAGDSRSK